MTLVALPVATSTSQAPETMRKDLCSSSQAAFSLLSQPPRMIACLPSGDQPANWVQVLAFVTSCGASSHRPVPSARTTQARSVKIFAARPPGRSVRSSL